MLRLKLGLLWIGGMCFVTAPIALAAWSVDSPTNQSPPTTEIGPNDPISANGQSEVLDDDLRVTMLQVNQVVVEVDSLTHTDAVQGDWMGQWQPTDQEWDFEGTYWFNLYDAATGGDNVRQGKFAVVEGL